jgi:hypothetical protein
MNGLWTGIKLASKVSQCPERAGKSDILRIPEFRVSRKQPCSFMSVNNLMTVFHEHVNAFGYIRRRALLFLLAIYIMLFSF